MKAELNKLGDAPRSYRNLIMLEFSEDTAIADEEGQAPVSRPLIGERFAKIEKARPAVSQVAVAMSNQLKKLYASPKERKEQADAKNEATERLQKRAIKTGRNPRKFMNKN